MYVSMNVSQLIRCCCEKKLFFIENENIKRMEHVIFRVEMKKKIDCCDLVVTTYNKPVGFR